MKNTVSLTVDVQLIPTREYKEVLEAAEHACASDAPMHSKIRLAKAVRALNAAQKNFTASSSMQNVQAVLHGAMLANAVAAEEKQNGGVTDQARGETTRVDAAQEGKTLNQMQDCVSDAIIQSVCRCNCHAGDNKGLHINHRCCEHPNVLHPDFERLLQQLEQLNKPHGWRRQYNNILERLRSLYADVHHSLMTRNTELLAMRNERDSYKEHAQRCQDAHTNLIRDESTAVVMANAQLNGVKIPNYKEVHSLEGCKTHPYSLAERINLLIERNQNLVASEAEARQELESVQRSCKSKNTYIQELCSELGLNDTNTNARLREFQSLHEKLLGMFGAEANAASDLYRMRRLYQAMHQSRTDLQKNLTEIDNTLDAHAVDDRRIVETVNGVAQATRKLSRVERICTLIAWASKAQGFIDDLRKQIAGAGDKILRFTNDDANATQLLKSVHCQLDVMGVAKFADPQLPPWDSHLRNHDVLDSTPGYARMLTVSERVVLLDQRNRSGQAAIKDLDKAGAWLKNMGIAMYGEGTEPRTVPQRLELLHARIRQTENDYAALWTALGIGTGTNAQAVEKIKDMFAYVNKDYTRAHTLLDSLGVRPGEHGMTPLQRMAWYIDTLRAAVGFTAIDRA